LRLVLPRRNRCLVFTLAQLGFEGVDPREQLQHLGVNRIEAMLERWLVVMR
jgi:hypothetical protein